MNAKNLIDNLVSAHSKIIPVTSVKIRFLKWVIICFLCLGAGISMLGLREDWTVLLTSPILLAQNLCILIGILVTGIFSIKLSVPSTSTEKNGVLLLCTLAGLWAIILLTIGILSNTNLDQLDKLSFGCIKDIVIIGIVPGISLFIFIRQGVVLKRRLAGVMGMVAAFSIGAFGVQYTCHNDGALHILVWHFLPLIILGGCGVEIGKRFIKKL